MRAPVLAASLLAFLFCGPRQPQAKDLTDVLTQGLSFERSGTDALTSTRVFAPRLAAGFAQAVSQAVTQEFPLISVAPAFSYRYDPSFGVFRRSTDVPGPLFSERALTLGKGQFDFGIGYAYTSFSDLNGTSLENIRSPALLRELHLSELTPGVEPFVFAPASFSALRMRIDLEAHVVAPTLRYGLTENWDVGLIIPIVATSLRVKTATVRVVDVDPTVARFKLGKITSPDDCATPVGPNLCPIGFRGVTDDRVLQDGDVPLVKSRRPSGLLAQGKGHETGVGDLLLRTKYHVWKSERGGVALGLALQVPSGEVRNLHSADDMHLSTFLYVSQVFREWLEPHLNLGIDVNVDDVERSSFLYAVGGSVLLRKGLGLSLDLLGRSEFTRFPVRLPAEGIVQSTFRLERGLNACTPQQPCSVSASAPFPFFPAKIKRNDIVDFSVGVRYAFGRSGSGFFGFILPVNDDGLRSDFIPSGGIQYTF